MTRLERIRLTKQEQKTAQLLGTIPVLLTVVTIRLLWKLKRQLFLLSLIIFIGWGINYLAPHAIGPIAHATQPAVDPVNMTEHDQIVAYIEEVFGPDAPKAFKLLSCENHALNPLALNDNTTWGGRGKDWGVMQINDSWQGVSGRFLKNWKINIQVGYQIYTESGRNFHLWTCGKSLGI